MPDIDQNKWRYQLATEKNYNILDVRTSEEFKQIRLPNSTNIDFYDPPNFIQELEKLDKDKSYYVYCKTGNRSAAACDLMKEMGFSKTYNLLGGISEYFKELRVKINKDDTI